MSDSAKRLEFVSFCIEMCAARDSVSGREVMERFRRHGVLGYLARNYEALHTQGFGYILPAIDDYIAGQRGAE
jgi:hypothetical protein